MRALSSWKAAARAVTTSADSEGLSIGIFCDGPGIGAATASSPGGPFTADPGVAVTVEPGNRDLADRAAWIDRMRAEGKPTVPGSLGDERKTNPFLRADVPEVAAAVGLAGADPVKVFAEVRKRKDTFR